MSKKTINMTEGNPLKLLTSFTIPMILGNVFQQLYTMVDTMVVGKFVSKDALAAVGATGAILFLMISVIIGFTVGTAIVTAQKAGAKDEAGIRAIFSTGFYIVLIESVALCIIGNLGILPTLRLLNTPEEIISQAELYLRINFSSCIAPILYNIVSQFMRSLGDSKTPLYALIISSVTNIVLDLVFVICFHMGVDGVAIATVIAQFISAVYCLVVTFKKFPEYIPQKGEWKISGEIVRTVLKFGIPMSLQNMLVSFGMMFVQSTINGYGTNIVAGYTAGNKVDQIGIQFMNSVGTAASTYAGQNYGAKKLKRLFQGIKASMLLNLIMTLSLSLVIAVFGKYIVLLFMKSTETEAISVAVKYLLIVCSFYLFCGISYVFQSYLRGVNYVAVPTAASIIELVVKIGISFGFSYLFGYNGIWWAWPVSWFVTDIFLIGFYLIKAVPELKHQFGENNMGTDMDYAQIFNQLFPNFFNSGRQNDENPEIYEELIMNSTDSVYQTVEIPIPEGITFRLADTSNEQEMEKIQIAVKKVDESWPEYFTNKDSKIFLALAGDQIASFCLIDSFGTAQVDGKTLKAGGPGCVGTVPEFRKKGIGLEMVKRATKITFDDGFDLSWIHWTGVGPWYMKLGYKPVLKWNNKGLMI